LICPVASENYISLSPLTKKSNSLNLNPSKSIDYLLDLIVNTNSGNLNLNTCDTYLGHYWKKAEWASRSIQSKASLLPNSSRYFNQ
jgi:hypothetical protein